MTDLWKTERRIMDLRNCAYLMVASGNSWGEFDPLAVISSYMGPDGSVSVKKFQQMWNEQAARFERERLARLATIPPNSDIPVEGK